MTLFDRLTTDVVQLDPELVVVFTPDHYTDIFHRLLPAFTVASAASAVADLGGHPGNISVHAEAAASLLTHLRANGVDAAFSRMLQVDHGLSSPMVRLCGSLRRYPVIPIVVNTISEPYVPFTRVRMLGQAVGRWLHKEVSRGLIIGSGGLSHNPVVTFPPFGTGSREIHKYQLEGPNSDLSGNGWLERVRHATLTRARELADMPVGLTTTGIDPDLDREFLRLLATGDLARFDSWDPEDVTRRGGIGAVEYQTWIAGSAAAASAGAANPVIDFYEPSPEYGIGLGVAHASN